jgi:hypothetical protein
MVPDGNLEGYQNSGVSANLALVNSQYLAAMLAPEAVKRSTLDLWGNVKVPLIEYYEQSSLSDREGWFTVNPEDPAEQDVYSSLIGIPMSGASQSPFIDYRMNVQTMYLRLNCSLDPFGDLLLPEGSFNYSGSKSDSWLWWFEDTFSTESSRSQVNPSALEPFVFGYSSKTFSWYANIECAIMTTYVEMEIKCPNTSACTASRLRRSTLDHPPPASTLFDLPKNWNFFASSFIKSVPGRSAYPSLIDTYLTDPLDPVIKQSVTANLTKQSAEVYAVRLVQLINAYWTILNGPYAINGGLKDDTAYLDPNITFLGEPGLTDELIARTWRTQGSKSTQTTVIRAHKEWVAALSISSIALILAGLIPPLLRYFIKGPDILMNISSLSTRNNPYIPLPTHATYMDAADRSRLLRELKVRFGDVGDDMEIGSLAIGSHDVSVMPVIGRIRKGRLYD